MRKTLPLQTGGANRAGSKRTADSMVVQPSGSRPFMKDFSWYKQSFQTKYMQIKEMLKNYANIEQYFGKQSGNSRSSAADIENGPADSQQQSQI